MASEKKEMEQTFQHIKNSIMTEAEKFTETLTELGQSEIVLYANGWQISAKKINKVYKDEQ